MTTKQVQDDDGNEFWRRTEQVQDEDGNEFWMSLSIHVPLTCMGRPIAETNFFSNFAA
ncbi:hypothetical protein [Desertivirga xinjiangensis]|uniref:hypothetical protein n=1 Tax=Desertivirga xinjiangensis TaxID=539206 RepID=UPI002109610C|nr:hypothetical protein [Pedobacter xinjiangensis]